MAIPLVDVKDGAGVRVQEPGAPKRVVLNKTGKETRIQ